LGKRLMVVPMAALVVVLGALRVLVPGQPEAVLHASVTPAAEWSGGWSASVVISNSGDAGAAGWTVTLSLVPSNNLVSASRASCTAAGQRVTCTPLSYDTAVPAGGTQYFGLLVGGDYAAPTDVTARPESSGATGTPSVIPGVTTSPTPGATPTPSPGATPTANSAPSGSSSPSPTMTSTLGRTPAPSSPGCTSNPFPTAYFSPEFTGPIGHFFNDQYITPLSDPTTGLHYVQVCYPAGSSDNAGGAEAAMQIAAGPATTYTLTYELRFPVGFQWETAGKLPGLCGGGCDNAGGSGSWSCRLMWRAGGLGQVLCNNQNELRGDFSFSADGRWHTVAETVVMNAPGVPDGTLEIAIDGHLMASSTSMEFRGAGDTEEVSGLMFSTFYGGGCVAPATTTVDFADFAVIR